MRCWSTFLNCIARRSSNQCMNGPWGWGWGGGGGRGEGGGETSQGKVSMFLPNEKPGIPAW